jgi:hypothetical protein
MYLQITFVRSTTTTTAGGGEYDSWFAFGKLCDKIASKSKHADKTNAIKVFIDGLWMLSLQF